MGLDQETINALLKLGEKKQDSHPKLYTQHERPVQVGPVKWFETTRPCINHDGFSDEGCRSPTYLEVQSKRLCMIHAIRELNRLLMEAGVIE